MPKRNIDELDGLDVFDKPIKKDKPGQYYELIRHTDTLLSNDNLENIEFRIPKGGKNDFLDIGKTKIALTLQILDKNGSALIDTKRGEVDHPANTKCSFVNNGLHSIFKNMDMYVNRDLVYTTHNMYSYISYAKDLFDTTNREKETVMKTQLWVNDDNVDSTKSDGYKKRAEMFGAATPTIIGGIHAPLFDDGERFLPPDTEIKLDYRLNKSSFFLMSNQLKDGPAAPYVDADAYKIKIKSAKLYCYYVKMDDDILDSFNRELSRHNMVYPVKHIEARPFTLTGTSTKMTIPDVCDGKLPELLVLGFVSDKSFTGASLQLSPYSFKNYNIERLSMNLDNQKFADLTLSGVKKSGEFMKSYLHFMEEMSQAGDPLNITSDQYAESFCFFPFRLSGDFEEMTGNISIDLEFKTALTETIHMIAYYVYNRTIEINKEKKCIPYLN